MKVEYNQMAIKQMRKLRLGKEYDKIIAVIDNIKKSHSINDIKNCKKMKGYKSIYRIKITKNRMLYGYIKDTKMIHLIEYLPRKDAYLKRIQIKLHKIDKLISRGKDLGGIEL